MLSALRVSRDRSAILAWLHRVGVPMLEARRLIATNFVAAVASLRPRVLAAATLAGILACADGSSEPAAPTPALQGLTAARVTVADSSGRGVPAARVTLDGGAAVAMTDSAGVALFSSVSVGSHSVLLALPLGFDTLPGQPRALTASPQASALTIQVRAHRSVTRTLRAGVPDTLSLANGVSVVTSTAGPGVGLPVTLRDSRTPAVSPLGIAVEAGVEVVFGSGGPPALSLPASPNAASARSGSAANFASGVTVTVLAPTPNSAAGGMFVAHAGTEVEPVYLFANATSTTVLMPNGQTRSVLLTKLAAPAIPMTQFMAVAATDQSCTGSQATARQLVAIDGGAATMDPNDTRKPLVLVHGWQIRKGSCDEFLKWDPASATWKDFATRFAADAMLAQRYRIFVARYPSFGAVLGNAAWLDQELSTRGLDREAVVLAHSMGGLVTRGVFGLRHEGARADPIKALITLGTPHEGSPLADIGLRNPNDDGSWGVIPDTPGARDLRVDSPLILGLRKRTVDGARVFSFGGLTTDATEGDWLLRQVAKLLTFAGVTESDRIVPLTSATPRWSLLQTSIVNHNHLQMTDGSVVFGKVREVLLSLATDCELPPARLMFNDFPLSGSIARRAANTTVVDATINPITIAGTLVDPVHADNFRVIENGCAKRVNLTRVGSGGAVKLDLVFIQDLSTSMGGAISGVRSSVATFTQSLALQGLDVRFAGVGFTGGGSIPTTPPGSMAEFLGPVQDFTTAAAFQAHVSTWHLGGDAEGNRDFEENPLEALEYAHQFLSWRAGAARAYILITDAMMHVAGDVCNGQGRCTDQTPASLLSQLGSSSVIHVVSPTFPGGFGANPRTLATGSGGQSVLLPSNGVVDLTKTNLSGTLGRTVLLTYFSTTSVPAVQDVRIRAEFIVAGRLYRAEIAPGLVSYRQAPLEAIRMPVP